MKLNLTYQWFEKNIEDYPDLWSKYSSYRKTTKTPFLSLKTTGNLSLGDKVKLEVEWARELRRYKARIVGFRKCDNEIFVEVSWNNRGDELVSLIRRFGTIFHADEVRKIHV